MRVTTGKIVNGRIEVPGETFPEGSIVTSLATEAREAFYLGAEAESALLEALKDADRGDVISGEELLREL